MKFNDFYLKYKDIELYFKENILEQEEDIDENLEPINYKNQYKNIKFTDGEINLLKKLGTISNTFPFQIWKSYIYIPKLDIIKKIKEHIRTVISSNPNLINRYLKLIKKLS